ncbi:MAG TPA: DinB family protein [Candidatus Saccharimonadales bacterium]|nr:DinB family protein [Candidatus Saccharimonadales bacterium]
MIRRIEDFQEAWAYESEATLKVFRALTPASLSQPVTPGGRTLGGLAWHLTQTLPEMLGQQAGLDVPGPAQDSAPPDLDAILRAYETSAQAVARAVAGRWTDAMLAEKIPMYGEEWTRGAVLTSLIAHQAHHRGQMTVLMRQAGLRVPGVYGPAAEDWAALGMPPQP